MTEESTSADIPTKPATPRGYKVPTKTAIVRKLLVRAKGATLAEIGKATTWQPHSKEQRPDGSVAYRIVPTVACVSVS
jgi:hypothetical protein